MNDLPAGSRARTIVELVPELLPVLAIAAAVLARIVPSAALASRVDLLLAALVLVTALDIDPRRLLAVSARWRAVLALAILPLPVLAVAGWALAQLVHGATRDGVMALGVSPAEVASVGLIGLMGGPAELGIATLAVSLVLSAVTGPPLLGLLGGGGAGHAVAVLPLIGRFALVVMLPLVVGLLIRGARPGLAERAPELSAGASLAVVALVYASLSGAGGGALLSAALISAAFLGVCAVLALASARAFARKPDRPLVLTIGMRDFAVASALATGAFGARAAHVSGVYGVLMLLAGASAAGLVRRQDSRSASHIR